MKKAITAIAAVVLALLIACTVFSDSIGKITAKLIYKENISAYVLSDETKSVKLKKNDYIFFGRFNGENILWKVISVDKSGRALLMSERALCFMPFDAGHKPEADSSNWETSTIRQWLNSTEKKEFVFECSTENKIKNDELIFSGGFLSPDNFTAEEISLLRKDGDKVLLPDTAMLADMSLKDRQRSPTAKAVINDRSTYIQFRKFCWYWTRTPISTNTSSVTAVTTSGGYYKSLANDGLMGVCPVVYINSSQSYVRGGNGTIATPYILTAEVGNNE